MTFTIIIHLCQLKILHIIYICSIPNSKGYLIDRLFIQFQRQVSRSTYNKRITFIYIYRSLQYKHNKQYFTKPSNIIRQHDTIIREL